MESSNKPGGKLEVAVVDQSVWVKISGRANFSSSLDLKNLVTEMRQRRFQKFVFELSDCIIMDSTFLGVLAGIGLEFSAAKARGENVSVQIANPNSRMTDILENLGVAHLFEMINTSAAPSNEFTEPQQDDQPATKLDVTRNCLEAHRILMNLNSANVTKFKDVAQFLAEDLKKLEAARENP